MMKKYILTLSCPDRKGIVAKVTTHLTSLEGFIVELAQYGDPSTSMFFMRCLFTVEKDPDFLEYYKSTFGPIAEEFSMKWSISDSEEKPRILIMVSKTGHCLNAILNQQSTGALPVEVVGVVSNHRDQETMCGWYNVPFHYLPVEPATKSQQEAEVLKLVEESHIDLVILARYMQILSPWMTGKLEGHAINIHHSFLPSFKGAKPYHQAHEHGVKLIGATAHYVSNELDEGPIIEQEVTRVDHNDTPEDLVAMGRDIESLVLIRAVKLHIEKRVFLNNNRTVIFR